MVVISIQFDPLLNPSELNEDMLYYMNSHSKMTQ